MLCCFEGPEGYLELDGLEGRGWLFGSICRARACHDQQQILSGCPASPQRLTDAVRSVTLLLASIAGSHGPCCLSIGDIDGCFVK